MKLDMIGNLGTDELAIYNEMQRLCDVPPDKQDEKFWHDVRALSFRLGCMYGGSSGVRPDFLDGLAIQSPKVTPINVDLPVGIKNKFTFHVDDIVTGEHKEYEAYNIVLNAMWSRLVNFQPFFVNIHFGTGTGTFNDPNRTSLYTHLGTKAATTEFQTRALPTSQWRRKIVLNPEEYIGATITEIGVAYGSTASNLVTHAAPKDAEGNPISIGPKTDTQIITIYADIYFVLQENMYGGKIKWVTPLANNELLSYLMGGSYPTQQFRVTKVPNFDIEGTAPLSHGQSANILVSAWIKDVVNKKTTTPAPSQTVRLGVSTGNGEIRGFGLGSNDDKGIFRAQLPIPSVRESVAISETFGEGDGERDGFNLFWNNPFNIIIKKDEQTIDSSEYNINKLKKGANILNYGIYIPTMENPALSFGSHLFFGLGYDDVLNAGYTPSSSYSWAVDMAEFQDSIVSEIGFRSASSGSGNRSIRLKATNSPDLSNPDTIYTTPGTSVNNQTFLWTISPISYRFYIFEIVSGSWFRQIFLNTLEDQITFLTPPPAGAVITADYTVDYIPKDEFHVLDLQAAIQYGEVI